MAKGVGKAGALGFLMCAVIAEALAPGTASGIATATVDAVVPALHATGIIGGEGLKATKPVGEGAREGISGLGVQLEPTPTVDTLPAPLEGG